MNRCPITYEPCGSNKYSQKGLHLLSKNLDETLLFPYSAQEQIKLAARYATKLSIQGIQPKLSVKLNAPKKQFEVVERKGTYIIKPQNPFYEQLPQNEDLTMRLAAIVGIETPLHGLVYCSDGSLSYFIKRFDRYGHGKKLAVEDFAQLSEATRTTKYESSMEKLIPVIDRYCSFPALEKVKLFRMMLFCFLVGNEDMHLKNFSLIRRPGKVEFTPAYDLLNSEIVLESGEELALPLRGKKSRFRREDLIEYYGYERLGLNEKVVEQELNHFKNKLPFWRELIDESFLSESMKQAYHAVLTSRVQRII